MHKNLLLYRSQCSCTVKLYLEQIERPRCDHSYLSLICVMFSFLFLYIMFLKQNSGAIYRTPSLVAWISMMSFMPFVHCSILSNQILQYKYFRPITSSSPFWAATVQVINIKIWSCFFFVFLASYFSRFLRLSIWRENINFIAG